MLVIAHRGASALAPENTLAAFRLALKMGAKAIEFDVHQTRDHELVVAHDDDLKRCGGDRRGIKDMKWKGELEKVDVGAWSAPRFKGERMPRLEDVFDLAPSTVELHLEIKHGSTVYPGIEKRVVDLIHRRDAKRRVLVSSFDHTALRAARALDDKLRLGYLLGRKSLKAALAEMKKLSVESLNIDVRQTTARLVSAAHERGFKVLVYTVKTPAELRRLDALGADGVFCNDPRLGS